MSVDTHHAGLAADPGRRRPWARIVRITKPLFLSEVRLAGDRLARGPARLLLSGHLPERGQQLRQPRLHDRHRRAEHPRPTGSMAIRYLLVFAASTAVAVFAKFCEERLGILWRGWLTGHLIDKYLGESRLSPADEPEPTSTIPTSG